MKIRENGDGDGHGGTENGFKTMRGWETGWESDVEIGVRDGKLASGWGSLQFRSEARQGQRDKRRPKVDERRTE